MSKWKEGDRVRVKTRPVTEEDRKKNRYFEHMAGLTGVVTNVYSDNQVALRVDIDSTTPITREVLGAATKRMRDGFLNDISEAQKKLLTKEEMEFEANYVVLTQAGDLEAA